MNDKQLLINLIGKKEQELKYLLEELDKLEKNELR